LGSWDLDLQKISRHQTPTRISILGSSGVSGSGVYGPIWGLFWQASLALTAWCPITSSVGSLNHQYPLDHGLEPPIWGHFGPILGSFWGLDLDLQKISRHQTPTRISILGSSGSQDLGSGSQDLGSGSQDLRSKSGSIHSSRMVCLCLLPTTYPPSTVGSGDTGFLVSRHT